ncbi:uncharacterized protein STEHIDRAFT_160726 [Stereum hirsutum FP-91666 SS1]|uniref:uncharacterized protein n=1 Tax=Stereum hirsutum (strain FP-91666) TaxID=721885 RepID=UPI0004449A73|nr:uncharacterized protein STEHIDRAFT_160726 [Stereum hirsutum FP-91666 SS1]EIM83123.1 hypothetical protein STEHIDRAFT_160726 [Stereum hirsutum FP-91666 SS1]
MAGSSIKVSKTNAITTDLEAPASVRASKATASKVWESLAKKAKKTLTVGNKATKKSSTKAAPGSKRKPQSDEEDVPTKKAKCTSIFSKASLASLKRGRRTVPNLTNSESESDLPSRVSTCTPLTKKGKAKALPEDDSSAGSSDEFEPSDESDEDEDDEDHDKDDDNKGGEVVLDDAAARLNRKQSRKAAKEKAIKKAIIAGTFDVRWPEDKENIPPAESAVRSHCLSTTSMLSIEVVTNLEDDNEPLVASAAPPLPLPPLPPSSVPIGSTKFPPCQA